MSSESQYIDGQKTDAEDKSDLRVGNVARASTLKDLFSRAGAEAFGTLILVFLLTYGLSNNATFDRSLNPGEGCARTTVDQVGLGLVYFFAAIIPTALFGHVSGAHFNPAVTIIAACLGLLGGQNLGTTVGLVFWYLFWQFGGALLGNLFTHWALGASTATAATGNGMVCAEEFTSFGVTFFTEAVFSFVLVLVALTVIPKMMKEGKTLAPALMKGAVYGIAGVAAGTSTNGAINFWRYFAPWLLYLRDNSSEMGRYVLGNLVVGPIFAGLIVLAYWYWIDGDFQQAFRREVDYFVSDLRSNRVLSAQFRKASQTSNPEAELAAYGKYNSGKTKQYNPNYSDTQAGYGSRLTNFRARVVPGQKRQ